MCAFMYIHKAEAFYLINNRMHKIGLVYQDEWGKPLNVEKEWNDYELNYGLMERIEREMKLDEITLQGNQKEGVYD